MILGPSATTKALLYLPVWSQDHSLNLNENILREPSNLDTAPGGLGLAKELGVDLVDGDEVVHVLDKDGSLEDVRRGRVGSSKKGGDVGEDLFLEVSRDLVAPQD
jgi:hypothetical protein